MVKEMETGVGEEKGETRSERAGQGYLRCVWLNWSWPLSARYAMTKIVSGVAPTALARFDGIQRDVRFVDAKLVSSSHEKTDTGWM